MDKMKARCCPGGFKRIYTFFDSLREDIITNKLFSILHQGCRGITGDSLFRTSDILLMHCKAFCIFFKSCLKAPSKTP